MANDMNKNRDRDNMSNDSRNKSASHKSGNFKNDPDRASEAGRKGGESNRGTKE